jgi:apolipoprotein N-acyltransferase
MQALQGSKVKTSTTNSQGDALHTTAYLPSRTVAAYALASAILLWLAFPPCELGWLGWFATIPWLLLIFQTQGISRRGYGIIFLASWLHWAALLQGVRLGHPALYLGWMALSAYLAIYYLFFIAWSRWLLTTLSWIPKIVLIPSLWITLEYARAYIITGFSTASLSHTQVDFPGMIQIADLAGAYGISFVIMTCSVAITLCIQTKKQQSQWPIYSCIWSVLLMIGTFYYGQVRLKEAEHNNSSEKAINILLVQGNVDTVLDANPDRPRLMVEHYDDLTYPAVAESHAYDLIVWPESALAHPPVDALATPHATPLPQWKITQEQFDKHLQTLQEDRKIVFDRYAKHWNRQASTQTHFLAGTTTTEYRATGLPGIYNSAVLISPSGEPTMRYYKMHLVMFGEYIPLADRFPWIYSLSPMAGGLSRGEQPQIFTIKNVSFCPNICFESTVPHLVRRQINTLTQAGSDPDVLINTTNDGWFYGSSILDLHFQCAILRAVENGKPFLIAANTGISAYIDTYGRVQQRAPKHASALLKVELTAQPRYTFYRTVGDWPVFLCMIACSLLSLWCWWQCRKT